jgi:glycine oxidase
MHDFIIVGKGLAANILALRFTEHQITYTIIGEPTLSSCSQIAAGLWNPIVFKRMTLSWKAEDLIAELKQFYPAAEQTLGTNFYKERIIIKPFFSEEEKNFWTKKAKGELSVFVDQKIHSPKDEHCGLLIPGSYGIVKDCGNIDVAAFLKACEKIHTDQLNETFDHALLQIEDDHVHYKHISAKNIIFCEGYLVKDNPLFHWLPMKPVKGEILDIEVKDVELNNEILNHNAFLFKAVDHFKMGATYDWDDLSEDRTEKGLLELKEKLQGLISAPYKIIKHKAGIRPSTLDRRPIIGPHPRHKNVFVFNGLGTKGVMLAPYFSKNFVYFYLNKATLNTDVNIKRYYPKFSG